MQANQMNGLFPIIRRVRRPLVPVQGTTGGADAKPAAPVAQGAGEAEEVQAQDVKEKRGEAASIEPTE